ncbi:MAG: protein-L-isoaspartate(D-aspartate) O-methyltransferase [Deltaproteobacteria bacterium]|nr:protein-L-isoaspartate(D-aspartate) O-methyltransferase [Deltaproteobacteria bacterium]
MNYEGARQKMLESQIRARNVRDPRVLEAIRRVPRHLFVEEALRDRAYLDKALPIGEKQTISQPYMVAAMSEALKLRGRERVLEIGTGSGYQTAVLAELAESVFSIERIAAFVPVARRRLESLGYYNVLIKVGDGTIGWSEHAPYDAILVTAAAPHVPRPLLEQLQVGGLLVAPIGGEETQSLLRIRRDEDGFHEEDLGECRFVKLIGRHGWEQ